MDKVTITRPPSVGVPLPPEPTKHWPTNLLEQRHRGWNLGLPYQFQTQGIRPPVMIAVGGGKGGVGKSLVSANLATRLALSGRKVLAVDLDIGGSNLHTYFGMQAPAKNLADAFVHGRETLQDVIVPTPVHGVHLLAGGREESWGGLANCGPMMIQKLLDAVFHYKEEAGIEFVIFDLGAGTNPFTLDVFSVANLGLVTVLPEPTSIENAYMFLKTSLFRIVENLGTRLNDQAGAEAIRQALLAPARGASAQGGYADKLQQLAHVHPEFVRSINEVFSGRVVGFTINQVRSQKDIDIGKSMEIIGHRYFGFQTRFCGFLNYDDAAWKSLRSRRMLVADFPHSVLSRRFSDLVRISLANLGF